MYINFYFLDVIKKRMTSRHGPHEYSDVYPYVDVFIWRTAEVADDGESFLLFRKTLSNINVNKKVWSDPALKSAYDWAW